MLKQMDGPLGELLNPVDWVFVMHKVEAFGWTKLDIRWCPSMAKNNIWSDYGSTCHKLGLDITWH